MALPLTPYGVMAAPMTSKFWPVFNVCYKPAVSYHTEGEALQLRERRTECVLFSHTAVPFDLSPSFPVTSLPMSFGSPVRLDCRSNQAASFAFFRLAF